MHKFTTLLFLVISFSSFSQERATLQRLQEDKKICKTFAEKSIHEISDGVLLVRLNFHQKQIDYLNKRDESVSAKSIEDKALITNKKIAESFLKQFDLWYFYFDILVYFSP